MVPADPDRRSVFVMPAGGGPAAQVSTSTGDDRNPNWSPDGRALSWSDAFRPDSNALVAWRDARGAWSRPARFPGYPTNLPWFPDGWLLVGDSLDLWRLNPRTGERQTVPISATDMPPFGWVVLSPDGRTLCWAGYRPGQAEATIEAWTIATGKHRTLAWPDQPVTQGVRYGLIVLGGRMYLPLVELQMEIWAAELGR